jgi:hypothetical protein
MNLMGLHTNLGSSSGGGSSGSSDIIKSYTVSSDGPISAGDVCEIVNGQVRTTKSVIYPTTPIVNSYVATPTSQSTTRATRAASDIIDDGHILMIINGGTSLYAQVISNTLGSISGNQNYLISPSGYGIYGVKVKVIDTSKAIVTYINNSYQACVVVLSINGTIISASTPYIFTAFSGNFGNPAMDNTALFKVDSNRFLLLASIHGVFITLNADNSITFGTGYSWATGLNNFDAALIDSKTIIVMGTFYNSGDSGYHSSPQLLTLDLDLLTISTTGRSTCTDNYTMLKGGSTNLGMVRVISITPTSFYAISYYYNGSSTGIMLSSYKILSNSIYCTYVSTNWIATFDSSESSEVFLFKTNNPKKLGILIFSSSFQERMIDISQPDAPVFTAVNSSDNLLNGFTYASFLRLGNSSYFAIAPRSTTNVYTIIRGYITSSMAGSLWIKQVLNPQCIALSSGNTGDTISCQIKGIAKGLSNLSPGKTYYCSDTGKLIDSVTDNPVGLAISPTELLIN